MHQRLAVMVRAVLGLELMGNPTRSDKGRLLAQATVLFPFAEDSPNPGTLTATCHSATWAWDRTRFAWHGVLLLAT